MKTHRETHKHTKQNKTNLKERLSNICTQFPFAFYFEACLYPVSIFYHCHKYDAQKGLRGKALFKVTRGHWEVWEEPERETMGMLLTE